MSRPTLFHRVTYYAARAGIFAVSLLPERLAYLPDPALDQALAERRAADLCDKSATRPPPLDAP